MQIRAVAYAILAVSLSSVASATTLDSTGAPCTAGNPCNNTLSAIGRYILQITSPALQAGLTGNPSYDPGTNLFVSPLLLDSSTTIGRSAEFADGSANDTTNSIQVGTGPSSLNLTGDPATVPAGFPSGNNEIHTAMLNMNLTNGAGFDFRAGASMTDHHQGSPGEVENTGVSDFPANAFFDIFIDIDVLGVGELFNTSPSVVQSQGLTTLPGTVLYSQGSAAGVPVFFNSTNPGFWNAGDQAATLLQSGFGVNMDSTQIDAFDQQFHHFAVNDPGLTANEAAFLDSVLPAPEPSTWMTMLAGAGLLALGRRRRTAR